MIKKLTLIIIVLSIILTKSYHTLVLQNGTHDIDLINELVIKLDDNLNNSKDNLYVITNWSKFRMHVLIQQIMLPRLVHFYSLNDTTHKQLIYVEDTRYPRIYDFIYENGETFEKAKPDTVFYDFLMDNIGKNYELISSVESNETYKIHLFEKH